MFDDILSNDDESDPPDPTSLPVEDQMAFYGSLFAMAAADDTVEREEMELIFETLDLEGLDEEDRREVHGYLMDPPPFSECLEELQDADKALQYGLMLNLVEIVVADDLIHKREKEHITEAQEKLGIADEQLSKMKDFAQEVERITERGIDDEHAANSLKDASSELVDVGVPNESVVISKSVGSLGAAGIGGGLGGIILGLGAAPTVAGPFVWGGGIYYLLKTLLGIDSEKKKEEQRRRRERKTQMAIQNLQETISTLVDQLEVLQKDAAKAEANQEAVEKLNDRLRKLKQVLKQREEQLASA